jgi:hypothetical protein
MGVSMGVGEDVGIGEALGSGVDDAIEAVVGVGID